MALSLLVIMSLMLVVAAVIQCLGPLFARPGIFFGVTVDPEFPGSGNGRRILWRYRRPVIVATGVCIAALWLAVPRLSGVAAPIAASSTIFLQVTVAVLSMALASRHVRPFAKPQAPTRTVSIVPRKPALPGGWPLFAGPMMIVGAAAMMLFVRRESMLLETYRGAWALLLVAFAGNAHFMWIAWLTTFRLRQINPGGSAANEENADKRFAYWLRLMSAYFQTAFMVSLAAGVARITPAASGPRFVGILMLIWLIFGTIVLLYVVKKRKLTRGEPGAAVGDNTPDDCWKWGLVYYNPEDPAVVVGTRAGRFGCDLNFGNKWSWVITGVILSAPFFVRFFWF